MQLDILETKLWKTNKKWGKKFYDQQKWNQNINKDLKNIATTISERKNGRVQYVLAVSNEIQCKDCISNVEMARGGMAATT